MATTLIKEEMEWLTNHNYDTPSKCSNNDISKLEEFSRMFFKGKEKQIVLENLTLYDMRLLCCQKWLNLCLIKYFVRQINKLSDDFRVISIYMFQDYDVNDIVEEYHEIGVQRFCIILNVGVTNNEKVFTGTRRKRGWHWTCLYIDIVKNKWLYADSLGLLVPFDLYLRISLFVKSIRRIYKTNLTIPKNIETTHIERAPFTSTTHHCTGLCKRNFPHQRSNGTVCGLAVILSAMIFSNDDIVTDILDGRLHLPWFVDIVNFEEYLRKKLIIWMIDGKISPEDLFFTEKKLLTSK